MKYPSAKPLRRAPTIPVIPDTDAPPNPPLLIHPSSSSVFVSVVEDVELLGCDVGFIEGRLDGTFVDGKGGEVGDILGNDDSRTEGALLGKKDGLDVGSTVGVLVGLDDGKFVVSLFGAKDGWKEGAFVGSTNSVGAKVGSLDGTVSIRKEFENALTPLSISAIRTRYSAWGEIIDGRVAKKVPFKCSFVARAATKVPPLYKCISTFPYVLDQVPLYLKVTFRYNP